MLLVYFLAKPALGKRDGLGQGRIGGNQDPADVIGGEYLVPIGLRVEQGLIGRQRVFIKRGGSGIEHDRMLGKIQLDIP